MTLISVVHRPEDTITHALLPRPKTVPATATSSEETITRVLRWIRSTTCISSRQPSG